MAGVTLVVPTFNRAPLLARSIGSVLAQSFTDLELIVVDYGSTDDSRALAPNGAIRAWWAARTTDPSGNFIDFVYLNEKNTDEPAHPYTVELLPARIFYTGHPSAPPTREVVFKYLARPVRTKFAGGMELRSSKIVDSIEMRGPGPGCEWTNGCGVPASSRAVPRRRTRSRARSSTSTVSA